VIKIAITVEAFEAIAATLPFSTVAVEPELDAKGSATSGSTTPSSPV
jgi:hypothetical protein